MHVNFADEGFNVYDGGEVPIYCYKILISKDGKNWTTAIDESQNQKDAPHALKILAKPQKARFVAIENAQDMPGGKFSVSGLRVFGQSNIGKPAQIENFQVRRDPADPRNIELAWDETPKAEGYILRWGASPNKLYTALTLRENKLKGSFLNLGAPYYFTVEAFNASGSGRPSEVKEAK